MNFVINILEPIEPILPIPLERALEPPPPYHIFFNTEGDLIIKAPAPMAKKVFPPVKRVLIIRENKNTFTKRETTIDKSSLHQT